MRGASACRPVTGKMRHSSTQRHVTPFRSAELPNPNAPFAHSKSRELLWTPSVSSSNLIPTIKQSPTKSMQLPRRSKEETHGERLATSLANRHQTDFQAQFENFMLETLRRPLYECIESIFMEQLKSHEVICWEDVPSLHALFSRKRKKVITHSDGLIGYSFYNRDIHYFQRPEDHPAYRQLIDNCAKDSDEPLGMVTFTLHDNNGSVFAVVQVFKKRMETVESEKEKSFIEFFKSKFSTLFQLIRRDQRDVDLVISELLRIMDLDQFLMVFQRQMEGLFHCRVAEIWRLNITGKELYTYRKTKSKADINTAGIVGEVLVRLYPVNTMSSREMSSYNEHSDGKETESVLAVPISNLKTNCVTAICLRGGVPIYTANDQELLTKIASYAVLSLDNIEHNARLSHSDDKNISAGRCMDTLIKMNEMLVNRSAMSDVVETAVEGMELLTQADRSTVFAVDRHTVTLKKVYSTCREYPDEISSNSAIPSQVCSFGQVVNLADAYQDVDFDSEIDKQTGYRTTSVLSVPMMNGRSETVGASEFLNRCDGASFENSDVKYVSLIMNYIGMMIDTQMLHRDLLSATSELRHLLGQSMAFMSDITMQNMLKDVSQKIMKQVNGESVAVYLTVDKNKMMMYLHDGVKLQSFHPMSHGMAAMAFKTKEMMYSGDASTDPRFVKDPLDDSGVIVRSVCIVPITGTDGEPFGVVEVANKPEPFTGDDMNTVKSLAALIGLCLDMRDLETISEHGNVNFEMERWIDASEKHEPIIPAKLAPVTAERIELESLQFNVHNWRGMDLFKAVFVVFDSFDLMKTFSIASETLFSFLYALRERYNDVPHHNWQHAIDILQSVARICTVTDIDSSVSKLDVLCLFIAALCQGIEHDGLGQTSKQYSCPGHCALTMDLTSTLLKNLGSSDVKTARDLIIRLIDGTDMSCHYSLIESAKRLERVDWSDQEQKILAFLMILKGSVIVFMSKEARICDRALLVIQKGIGSDETEELQMKESLAFGSMVASPLFSAASSIIGEMKIMEDGCRCNMDRWKQSLYPQE